MNILPLPLQRFADFMLSNPSPQSVEPGRFYRVPCVKLPSSDVHHFWGNNPLPLLGTVHEDREITGFKAWHIHVDTRFMTVPDPAGDALGKPLSLTWHFEPDFPLPTYVNAPLLLTRKMARRPEAPLFPVERAKWLDDMELACKDKRVSNGTCPHRGLPLAAGRDLGNGVTQCPGHGLCWNREGRMVYNALKP